ncbi:hypothetical protein DL96DRAFT_1683299 [Flagelloscypha sp. PMI_526]|nr:hypothetical protein DL96DRAFT_1683299 [Flagelloscypha sp. PMI_526]
MSSQLKTDFASALQQSNNPDLTTEWFTFSTDFHGPRLFGFGPPPEPLENSSSKNKALLTREYNIYVDVSEPDKPILYYIMGGTSWTAWNDPRGMATGCTKFPLVWNVAGRATQRILFRGKTDFRDLRWHYSRHVLKHLGLEPKIGSSTSISLSDMSIPVVMPPNTPNNKERRRLALESRQKLTQSAENARKSVIDLTDGPDMSQWRTFTNELFGIAGAVRITEPYGSPIFTSHQGDDNAPLGSPLDRDPKFIHLAEKLRGQQNRNGASVVNLAPVEIQQFIGALEEKDGQLKQHAEEYAALENSSLLTPYPLGPVLKHVSLEELNLSQDANARKEALIIELETKLKEQSEGHASLESEVARLNKAIYDFDKALTAEKDARATVVRLVDDVSNTWDVLHEISTSFNPQTQ